MKIAIHHRKESFSEHWIEYCKKNNIQYKVVNAYSSDIIKQVKDCDIFMWHHHHDDYKDTLAAKRILFALQHSGLKVFPDFKTGWHFDDKIAQKYLLEAIEAPLIPSFIFYDKKNALTWINQTEFPKVFKLKGGSGARNVQLVKNRLEGKKIINKAFSSGFSQTKKIEQLRERIRKFRTGKANIKSVIKGVGRLLIPTQFSKMQGKEKGYAYFQEFIPNNKFDIRLIIIGNRAYGMKRIVRENDFRASGSKNFVYDKLDPKVIKIAFEVSRKLGISCLAFDFVYSVGNKPLIVEISYGYGTEGSSKCKGYWDDNLNWYKGEFNPFGWMVEDLISKTKTL